MRKASQLSAALAVRVTLGMSEKKNKCVPVKWYPN